MEDNCGRRIDYLRVSVTDRCNLRCVYCMPPEGVPPMEHAQILSYEEILRVCKSAAALGVKKIRLTGGEPLVRKGLTGLIRGLREIPGIERIAMTTNGMLFAPQAAELAQAGLSEVNISLDTLDPEVFAKITRRDAFGEAIGAIDAALAQGMAVKLNCVAAEEFGVEQALAVAELAKERAVDVRFIEMMPIGMGAAFTPISGEEMRMALARRYGEPVPCEGAQGGPAKYWRLPGFVGKIGCISAVSDRFCDRCNRVRLTADGFLKLCLHYDYGVDLRELLRNGISQDALTEQMQKAIAQKPNEHRFGEAGDHLESHRMVQIGG